MKISLKILIGLVTVTALTEAHAMRWYSSSTGRWFSRDPIQEPGFAATHTFEGGPRMQEPNVYVLVRNNPVNFIDPLGLWATDVHHQIVADWLTDPKYGNYLWRCCRIRVRAAINEGSDAVDGDVGIFTLCNPGFYSAQSSGTSHEHAMKGPTQTAAQAQALYNQFMSDHIQRARNAAAQARTRRSGGGWDCALMYAAIKELGMAFHAFSDELSPAHAGFQTWYGPIDGVRTFGVSGYADYVQAHKAQETMQVYQGMRNSVVSPVRAQFQGILDELLKE